MFVGSLLLRPRVIVPIVAAAPSGSGGVTQFVLVAPGAHSVALVGDFNDWDLSATKLVRQGGDGVWYVTLPLRPGRYRYAFVVDGTVWRNDPNAVGMEDDFGRPNSVVTIGGT
jgi:1,4-alpha-glucan branching enzyme